MILRTVKLFRWTSHHFSILDRTVSSS